VERIPQFAPGLIAVEEIEPVVVTVVLDDSESDGAGHCVAPAAKLNGRPRQTLNWMTPSEKLDEVLR